MPVALPTVLIIAPAPFGNVRKSGTYRAGRVTTTPKRKAASKRASRSTTESEFVPSELRRVFSRNLVAARRTLGMTQRDLATAAGVSQKHISFIEAAAGVNVTLDTLAALAKHVNKTPAQLLTPSPPSLSRRR